MIAQAKTSTPDLDEIDRQITKFNRFGLRAKTRTLAESPTIVGISRLEFWFKPTVISHLRQVKNFIDEIPDDDTRLFFQVAFSETVRASSNTRNDEFKLYRYDAERLKKFNPDVFGIMAEKLKRNRVGLQKFLTIMRNFRSPPYARIYDLDTVQGIPSDKIAPDSVDIVVTSPPYGDSHTTVAYGQYSRLSAAWLGLPEPDRIDAKLMGSRIHKNSLHLPCDSLNQAIEIIHRKDAKRALEVVAFYTDLYNSISHVAPVIKPGGYSCYVVGNRTVKGVVLPTDEAIRCFFEDCGFEHIGTFHRSIPNKRMPLCTSPTNVPGAVENTMLQEHIVVLRRKIPRQLREKRRAVKPKA